MRAGVLLFGRACCQVALVSANVVYLSQGRLGWAFVTGVAISYLWFHNARSATQARIPGADVIYALGAGCGTIAGAWLSRFV